MGSGSVFCSVKFTECALESDCVSFSQDQHGRCSYSSLLVIVKLREGGGSSSRGIEVARKLMDDDDDDDPGRNICFRRVQQRDRGGEVSIE